MYINIREKNTKDYYIQYYKNKTKHNKNLMLNTMILIDKIVPDNQTMSWKEFLPKLDYAMNNCKVIVL